MTNLFTFLQEGSRASRRQFLGIAGLALLLLLSFVMVELVGLSSFYQWHVEAHVEAAPYPLFSDLTPFLASVITTEVPLIFQKAFGVIQTLDALPAYGYLILFYLSIAGGWAMTSYLKGFWYFVSIGVFLLLIALSGLGRLGWWGYYEHFVIVPVSLLVVGCSYYFNTVRRSAGLGMRFLAFVLVLAFVFLLIYLGSEYEAPFLLLSRLSYLPATLLTIVFILMVGHEVIFAILTLTTSAHPSTLGKSYNLAHFAVFSLIYLLNLLAIALHRVFDLTWGIYYINLFFLLALSTVLGLWGLRARAVRYERVLSFYPFAAYLYLLLVVVSFGTLLFQSLHANDPFLEAMENIILYSHLGFGFMFFMFLVVHFMSPLSQNLPVYKVAYHSTPFYYRAYRFGGLVFVLALFFYTNKASLNLCIAGYYNGMADLEAAAGKPQMAKHYYQESALYSYRNHHANFALAQHSTQVAEQIKMYERATQKQPTPFAFVNLGKAYEEDSQFFEALFAYQKGLEAFPEQWALQNNLALLYNRTRLIDSARYFLAHNHTQGWKQSVIRANLAGFCAQHGLPYTLPAAGEDAPRFDVLNNELANELLTADTVRTLASYPIPRSTALNLYTYSYVRNMGLNAYATANPEFLSQVNTWLNAPHNAVFGDELKLLKALNQYALGQIGAAFETLKALKGLSETHSGKWATLLGKWAMTMGQPLLAAQYFEDAQAEGYPMVKADLAYAYAQTDRKPLAQYLAQQAINAPEVSEAHKAQWEALALAIRQGQDPWKTYRFEREKQWLDQAKQAQGEAQAQQFQQLGIANPFFESGVLAAAQYFQADGKDADQAYHILLKAIQINEYSVPLLKAYIKQCLAMGLTSYAESTVIRLMDILPPKAYEAYEVKFETMLEDHKTRMETDW